jgi:O-acetyl-ADP-ribose deacetylase (regulator of RNase III)
MKGMVWAMAHQFVIGNLFESSAQALVNTVNCEGYMGKGIAYQFKLLYPENYRAYASACKTGQLKIGKVFCYQEKGKTIINFPTKDKWREKSEIDYIERGLVSLAELIDSLNIKSVAIPPLGSGNGGLNWLDVKSIIESQFLTAIPASVNVYIYEPSKEYKAVPTVEPKLTLSALVLLQIKLHLTKFGRLRLQKTAFLTNIFLGEDYFRFVKGQNGPYDKAIDNISKDIKAFQEFHGDIDTQKTYSLIYSRLVSNSIENKMHHILPAIKDAAEYVNKIEDNDFLECLTTILYLVQSNFTIRGLDTHTIVKLFKGWSEDKAKRFTEEQIMQGIEYLYETNLLTKMLMGYVITKR